jgi:hypothetical protein
MTYEIQAKNLVEKYLAVTKSYDKAIDCAKMHIRLCIEDIEKDAFVNSYAKLRLHELKKIKSYL